MNTMTVVHADAELGLGGLVRDSEGTLPGSGQHAFRIKLPGKPPFYGGYDWRFPENKIEFVIDVFSFGYTSEINVGNPHPQARQRFSAAEAARIEELIRFLFCSPDATKLKENQALFTSRTARFLDTVFFLPGWLLIGPPIRMA